jgi:hypothetical protein
MDTQISQQSILLEKLTGSFKLYIPVEVERKIRYLCNKISQVEWSGTLFYTAKGSFQKGDLEIHCVDLFPMDIGSQAYTEFDMSPAVIAYMTEHPELLDCQLGLIHSHNNMATFFSGTDLNTLKEEGIDRNHFVSLIVNNAGTYTAAITRNVSIEGTIKEVRHYRTFEDKEEDIKSNANFHKQIIEYKMLDVIKEGEPTSYNEIEARLQEIRDNKAKVIKPVISSFDNYSLPSSSFKQSVLFERDNNSFNYIPKQKIVKPLDPNEDITFNITVDHKKASNIALQLITGAVTLSETSKIDPVKWANQMVSLFDKRFDHDMGLFDLWIQGFMEFLMTSSVPDEFIDVQDEYISSLAGEISDILGKLPENKYIESIKEELLLWMK